jgi:hypothetical protein
MPGLTDLGMKFGQSRRTGRTCDRSVIAKVLEEQTTTWTIASAGLLYTRGRLSSGWLK